MYDSHVSIGKKPFKIIAKLKRAEGFVEDTYIIEEVSRDEVLKAMHRLERKANEEGSGD